MTRNFMMRKLTWLAMAFVLAFSGMAFTTNDAIRVEGGLISGAAADGVRSFKGIPFAAPPVGELRWKAPQPVVAWEGVRKCEEFGPECPQAPYPASSMYFSPPLQTKMRLMVSRLPMTASTGGATALIIL